MPEVDRTGSGGADQFADPAPDEVRGFGGSAGGEVQAVASEGRLTKVDVAPRLLRGSADDLAEHILAAVNAAFDDLRAKMPEAEGIDPAVLARRLGEFQEQALYGMSVITAAIGDAMGKLHESTGIHGDPSPNGLAHLLEETRNLVDAVAGAGNEEAPELQGVGEAGGGLIRVVAPPGGRLESMTIDRRAMRMASDDLGANVVTAVNAALDDLRARSAEQPGPVRVDTARLRALREESTEQMAAYTRALRDLMASIRQR